MPIRPASPNRMLVAAGHSRALAQISQRQFEELTDGRVSVFDKVYAGDVVRRLKNELAPESEQSVARHLLEAVEAQLCSQTTAETAAESWVDIKTSSAEIRDAVFRTVDAIVDGLKR